MHYTQAKGILSNNNGMNIYRGCLHGCIYCDSRSKCYQINHDFEDVEVKGNAIELLEAKLQSKRNPCMIGTGSMSDPYIPLEKELQYTRKALELINKYNFGVSLITKSNLVLRDMDLLEEINHKTKAVVNVTLTTYDEDLCKIIEPNVCTTKERFEILKECQKRNIPTIVWLCPILPFINDTEENLKAILQYCIDAKVYGIMFFGFGLTLREGNREYFYQKLDEHFPKLKHQYITHYGNSYTVSSPKHKELSNLFYSICKEHNIVTDPNKLFQYMNEFPKKKSYEQLTLF